MVRCPQGPPSWPCPALYPNWSCSLPSEVALLVDLAQVGEGLREAEREHRPRVLGGREGTPGWEADAETAGESVPRAGTGSGERASRVVPGLKPQTAVAVAMDDGSGSVQPGCMEQGPAPVGSTEGRGTPLDKCSQVVLTAQGPPLLESEWTVGTDSRVREDTEHQGLGEGNTWRRTQAEPGWGEGWAPWAAHGCSENLSSLPAALGPQTRLPA